MRIPRLGDNKLREEALATRPDDLTDSVFRVSSSPSVTLATPQSMNGVVMRSIHRRALATLLFAASGAALAGTPAVTGLGQAWPNATDVSTSPHYHVYLFQKSGVRYVQVNDGAGTVRGALAIIGNEAVDLPIGVDASRWSSTSDTPAPVNGETVYRDETMTLIAAPQSTGQARLMLAPGECNGDPVKCSLKGP